MDNQQENESEACSSEKSEWRFDGVDLFRLCVFFWRNKWLILLIVFASASASLVVHYRSLKYYTAEVLLASAEGNGGGGISEIAGQFASIASMAGVNIGSTAGGTEKTIAIMKSRKFSKQFIDENELMKVFFAESWDQNSGGWIGTAPTEAQGYKIYYSIVKISSDPETGLIKLSVSWTDPNLAAEWANKLVKKINDHMKEKAKTEASRSIEYLKQEIRRTDIVEMKRILFQLVEAQTKGILLANAREEFAFSIIDPATAPEESNRTSGKLVLFVGLIFGFFLGVFLAIMMVLLKRLPLFLKSLNAAMAE